MKVLLTGASGLLGGYLEPALRGTGADVVPVSHTTPPRTGWMRCDLTDTAATIDLLERVAPELIIHAAALTNVDLCDAQPQLADKVNRRTTELLASGGARIVLVSTDSVFDGSRGSYSESDDPAPVNEYARSKLRAEEHVSTAASGISIRTNFFGRSTRDHGLAEWMLRELRAGREIIGFEDVVFSPLYCRDAARAIAEIATSDETGVLHLGGEAVNKYEFGVLVANHHGLDARLVRRGSIADVTLKALRPLNTSLDSTRAESLLGRAFPGIVDSVVAMARDAEDVSRGAG